jgi:sulfur carrier protein
MRIILNGQVKQIPDGSTILKIIERFCRESAPVIAEVNGQIIQRPQWEESPLKEGDTVELVSFVGGG